MDRISAALPMLPGAETLARLLRAPLSSEDGHAEAAVAGERAAVVILLFDISGRPHTLLTRRADHLLHHPGQIALPGGRRDPTDASLVETAVRELWEELGIDPAIVDVVCRMDDVHTMVSGFVVTPFVALATGPVAPVPSDGEIARVLEVPVEDIVDAHRRLPRSPSIATLRYPLDGEDVWGATARILHAFVELLDRTIPRDLSVTSGG